MTQDPAITLAKGAGGGTIRIQQRLAEMERRLAALEQSRPTFQVTAGQPTTTPRTGTGAVDSSNTRLWLYVNGAWHYTALT